MTSSFSASSNITTKQHHVILFYKYHPLSDDFNVMEQYRMILQTLCESLTLQGRILIGCSKTSEGINGTLSNMNYVSVLFFTYALLHDENSLQKHYDQHNHNDYQNDISNINENISTYKIAVETYWKQTKKFFQFIGEPELMIESPEDFKWSTTTVTTNDNDAQLFPDLNIKLVKELIGTGGLFTSIQHHDIAKGYLTPNEWHQHLSRQFNNTSNNIDNHDDGETKKKDDNDSIIIDCRNIKEYDIGHFNNSIHPNMTTFAQFPQWVQNHSHILESKKNIYMYCTGGIRCEKASAYIRNILPTNDNTNVYHLKGGIHKYLEEYGSSTSHHVSVETATTTTTSQTETSSLWHGKNFVFDSRVSADANTHGISSLRHQDGIDNSNNVVDESHQLGVNGNSIEVDNRNTVHQESSFNNNINNYHDNIVGRCLYCEVPYDVFDSNCICTVCREPVLVCMTCRNNMLEYHCKNHFHLKSCYFTNLKCITSINDLQQQLNELIYKHLQPISIGRKFKQKRNTLQKQIYRIRNEIKIRNTNNMEIKEIDIVSSHDNNPLSEPSQTTTQNCRSCGDANCQGQCWGFFGLKRRDLLQQQKLKGNRQESLIHNRPMNQTPSLMTRKKTQTTVDRNSMVGLLPSQYRDSTCGIRVLPSTTRFLQCNIKASWCGRSVLSVIQNEFHELRKLDQLEKVIENGLLLINDKPIKSMMEVSDIQLKSSDKLGRFIHWHEAPVHVPEKRIQITKKKIPIEILINYAKGLDRAELSDHDCYVYVCNKPSTVPVHPAGPYYLNSLTAMIQAQIMDDDKDSSSFSAPPLKAIHRTDRPTSGLTLCCTSTVVARFFHHFLFTKQIEKLYLAQVHGKFPSCYEECNHLVVAHGKEKYERSSESNSNYHWDDITKSIHVNAPVYTVDVANGIRIVDARGKQSESYFQFLKFNSNTNTSLIACNPITGRNHQLRVHLKWLGYPIVNDFTYGSPSETTLNMKEHSIQLMEHMIANMNDTNGTISNAEHIDFNHSGRTISQQDMVAAQKACVCCNGSMTSTREAIISSFTSSQLLESGHSIHLHALRYRLKVVNEPDNGTGNKKNSSMRKRKKTKHTIINEEEEVEPKRQLQENIGIEISNATRSSQYVLDFEVDMPSWYESLDAEVLIF